MKSPEESDLPRKLGLFSLTNIVVANMIGAGIFTTSGLLMGDLKSPGLMLILWITGGVVALCGALSYGELGAAMPQAGGEYNFLSKLYHPVFGFLSGWVSFIVGFSTPIAASAIGFSEYLVQALPVTTGLLDLPVSWQKKLISILLIIAFSMIHLRGIVLGAKIQNVLTLLKVILIVGLIFIGFLIGQGDFSHLSMGQPVSASWNWKTVGLSLMWIMFAYSGWNASTYIGSEIREPGKNLPWSLLLGTGTVLILYFFLNLLFIYATPPAQMEGVIAIGGLAASHLFGSTMNQVISVLIAIALFSSLSAFIILGPRVYYAMAKDGYFFKFLARVHPKLKVPYLSILVQACISIIMVLSGTFDQILTYMGFSLGIFPILAVFGVFKLRMRGKAVLRFPGYPWVQVIYLTISIGILVLAYMERPIESSIAIITVVLGLPFYYFFFKMYRKTPNLKKIR